MRKVRRRFRFRYSGECELIADNQELAFDKMNRILDSIGDVYEVYSSENEINDVESEGLWCLQFMIRDCLKKGIYQEK